jgi:hypothetical protein
VGAAVEISLPIQTLDRHRKREQQPANQHAVLAVMVDMRKPGADDTEERQVMAVADEAVRGVADRMAQRAVGLLAPPRANPMKRLSSNALLRFARRTTCTSACRVGAGSSRSVK